MESQCLQWRSFHLLTLVIKTGHFGTFFEAGILYHSLEAKNFKK